MCWAAGLERWSRAGNAGVRSEADGRKGAGAGAERRAEAATPERVRGGQGAARAAFGGKATAKAGGLEPGAEADDGSERRTAESR